MTALSARAALLRRMIWQAGGPDASEGASRFEHHWTRDHLADDVRDGAVQLDPHARAKHIEACASVPSETPAERASRFLADL